MIDRTINIITLLIVIIIVCVSAEVIQNAWRKTEPWEQSWVANKNAEQTYKYEVLVDAIKNAHEQNEYADEYKLKDVLESMYKPSGVVYTRFNASEIKEVLGYIFGTTLVLFIPICINYIRHGSFRLWNKSR